MLPAEQVNGRERRRRSTQEESADWGGGREEEQQDHHESEDEDTTRENVVNDDGHVNDEIFLPPIELEIPSASTSADFLPSVSGAGPSFSPSSSFSSQYHQRVINANNHRDLMTSVLARVSPEPIDPIDIDYDPSTLAHESELQV